MGTKYNSEGYRDPTAHLGIGLAEPEQTRQIVRLAYRNGRMELYVKEFFPCTIAVGRKIFPLIKKFAGKKDIDNLRMFLEMEVSEHSEKYMEFARRRTLEAAGSKQFHFYNDRSREEQVLYKRAKSNLEMLNYKGGKPNEDRSING